MAVTMKIQELEDALNNLCDEVVEEHIWGGGEVVDTAHKTASEILGFIINESPLPNSNSIIELVIDFAEFDSLWATERLLALSALPITKKQIEAALSTWTAQEFYRAISLTYPYGEVDEGSTPLLISSFEELFSSDESQRFCENIRKFANVTLHALKLKNS